jgi:hypothetical protein
MPAEMFTHSRDGRQPAPEGTFARTHPILVDGDDRDGGADVLVRRHNPTTTRPRRRGGDGLGDTPPCRLLVPLGPVAGGEIRGVEDTYSADR